jgi:ABC-2 type transport system permease protein
MRTIFFILQKEFNQIKRNLFMLQLMIILPVVQLIVLANAATMDIKNINLAIVDRDVSTLSRQLISKFEGSPFFTITYRDFSEKEALNQILINEADAVIVIPENFQKKLIKNDKAKLQFSVNAINGMSAGITNYYIQSIILDFNKKIISDWKMPSSELKNMKSINVKFQHWYNKELIFNIFMVPGILVVLVTIMGMFLPGLNLVREKEIGTIEQINVTPIKKYQFILGKLIPFLIISFIELTLGLLVGIPLFSVPVVGSFLVLYGAALVYLFAVLGFGLLLSTFANTQQQLMFLAFFVLIIYILMSGIFTPTESMPDWGKAINAINPIYYFMNAIRMIILKGAGFYDIRSQIFPLLIYGIIVFSLAIFRYRKTAV